MACAILALTAGCVNVGPVLHPEITPAPTAAPVETAAPVTEDPVIPITTDRTEPPAEDVDAMGNPITGSDHYLRYLSFRDVYVYEEEGDTFLDGVLVNDYIAPISCAVDVVYTDDEGAEIARARLQTRDGSYLLVLKPGENVVLARILTDITLTGRDFEFVFNKETGITPIKQD